MPDRRFAALEAAMGAAGRVLVVLPAKASVDAFAAASVFASVIAEEGKQVTLVAAGHAGLPEPLQPLFPVVPAPPALRTLRIRLPVAATALDTFSYDIKDRELRIELLPKEGQWPREDVAVEAGAARFDALVAFGFPSRGEIAGLVAPDPEWMRDLPSVHLTLDPQAETWASTTVPLFGEGGFCEAFFAWLKERGTLAPRLAHNLLTGIVAATNGFRAAGVQSGTLLAASELVALGADRQDIVNRLWRTLSVPALNLWGRALMRLALRPELGLAVTVLTEHDFLQAKTDAEAVSALGRYLLDHLPETGLVLVLTAWNGAREARVFARRPLDAELVARWFGGTGEPAEARWTVDAGDLLAAQASILAVLERELPRLGRSR